MTAERRKERKEKSSAVDRLNWLTRFLLTALVLAIILYVAAFFIVRTDGFRYLVEERLREAWDWPVRLERVWLSPDLSLVLVGIESEGFEEREGPGMAIEELRLGWSLSRLLHPRKSAIDSVEMRGGIFSFQQDAARSWRPAYFFPESAKLAEWLSLRHPGIDGSEGYRFVGGQVDLLITAGAFYWWNADSTLVVSVQGLTFEGARTELLGEQFRYTRMSATDIFSVDRSSREVTRQLLWLDDRLIHVHADP